MKQQSLLSYFQKKKPAASDPVISSDVGRNDEMEVHDSPPHVSPASSPSIRPVSFSFTPDTAAQTNSRSPAVASPFSLRPSALSFSPLSEVAAIDGAAESINVAPVSTLPACSYGAACNRLNPDHRHSFSHPCKFGAACTRRNADHWLRFSHPPGHQQPEFDMDVVDDQDDMVVEETVQFAVMSCDPANTFTMPGNPKPLSVWYRFQTCVSSRAEFQSAEDVIDFFLALHPMLKFSDFGALHTFIDDVCDDTERSKLMLETLPAMLQLALQLPQFVAQREQGWGSARIPLLVPNQAQSIALSRPLVASLLCCAFFGIVPSQRVETFDSHFLTFFSMFRQSSLTSSNSNKLRCFLNYFSTVTTRPFAPGDIVLVRQVLQPSVHSTLLELQLKVAALSPLHAPRITNVQPLVQLWQSLSRNSSDISDWQAWLSCPMPLCPLLVESDQTLIEDAPHPALEVDFANEYIGGGVLGNGCVQEEIRFAVAPELLISQMFCSVMGPREALLLLGSERFSKYSGYSRTFTYEGPFLRGLDTLKTQISAIDAIPFSAQNSRSQFSPSMTLRELTKAFAGFLPTPQLPSQADWDQSNGNRVQFGPVVTGNWGAGAFNGHAPLKAVLQWAAASAAGRPAMHYCPFGRRDVVQFLNALAAHPPASVGDLLRLMVCACVRLLDGRDETLASLLSILPDPRCAQPLIASPAPCFDSFATFLSDLATKEFN